MNAWQPEVWTPDPVTGRWVLDPLADPNATARDIARALGTAGLFVVVLVNIAAWSFVL